MSEPYSDFVPHWLEFEERLAEQRRRGTGPTAVNEVQTTDHTQMGIGPLIQALEEGVANGDLPYSVSMATARHDGGERRDGVPVLS